jgi:nucleoside-diphosphate-sugar epimerase
MTTPRSTIAVTGAGGFVGRHVVTWLAERGHRVVAVSRRPVEFSSPLIESRAIPERPGRPDLGEAFRGAQGVVHLAGRAHVMAEQGSDSLAAYREANVGLTRTCLQAAAEVGCRRFVLASSVKAVGESTAIPWTEDTEPHPVDPYGVSKLEAERLVAESSGHLGVASVIVRFPLIYGPGMRANMLALFRAVDRGRLLPLGAVANRRSLLYVGNAAAALALAVEPGAATGLYFLSDGQDLSTPELVRAVATGLGTTARLVSVPPVLLRWAGAVGGMARRVGLAAPDAAAMGRLLGSLTVDIGRARDRLGYRPPFSVADGMRLTARWYLDDPTAPSLG